MTPAIIFKTVTVKRTRKKKAPVVSCDPSEGYAKLHDTDEDGKVTIYARMSLEKPFKLVEALGDYHQAKKFVEDMQEDERYRRRCIRQAKREGLH